MAKTVTRLFDKELLKQIMWDDAEDYEVLEDEITDTSRWSVHHYMVFKELSSGKCYGVGYSRGATECQDEQPFEYEGDEITCEEVEPVEVKVIHFKPVLA